MTRFFLPIYRNACLGLISFAFLTSAAAAQNVTVIGPITPGNLAQFNSTTIIKDSGVAGGGLPNSVKNFGALGNSNGTTGNGHDDTAAISAALDSGDAYVPCGIYRITSTITKTGVTTQYRLHGEGFCSQIYLDTGTTQPAFNFAPASACGPCLRVENLNFIPPTTVGNSTAAVSLTNETQAVFASNYISGYQIGFSLTTSFAPLIIQNRATGLAGALLFIAGGGGDKTLNNARIWNNTVQSSGITATSAVLALACNGANSVSVIGNDLEGDYIGVQFASCTSVDFSDNYVENSTITNLFFSGTNVGFTVRNNWFGTSPTTAISNVSKMLFGANTIFGWAITWASTATGVILEPTNDLLSGGSIGALTTPTLSACGTGSPSMVGTRLAGQVTEGTTATGCTVTFELPFDTVAPACTVSPITVSGLAISSLTSTNFQVTNTSGSGGIFSYLCEAFR
jgi:hypothetical protein